MYKLFISHSSKDIDLVERLLTLFQLGMGISREDIFCTSLTGTLETGKPYIEKTRKVVTECNAVVFCMTESYLQSKFCLAELGASWACNQQIFPLLAPGMTEKAFANTPLEGVQCLHMDRKEDLHQLGDDFQKLGLASLSFTRYGKEVECFLKEDMTNMRYSNPITNTEYKKADTKDILEIERQARNQASMRFLAGVMYSEGILISQDKKKGYDFLEWAAQEGYTPAITFLASECRQGACSFYELSDLFEQVRKAEEKEESVVGLGTHYRLGLGCEIDIEKALYWYEKEAASGVVDAYEAAGDIYQMQGRHEEAIRYYTRCMEEGSLSAACKLGILYQEGWGGDESLGKAVYFLDIAAKAGITEAKFRLGEIYFTEHGLMKRNFTLAGKWYLAAAKDGHVAAMERSGYCCQHGLGVAKDVQKALEWYRKSAAGGYGEAYLRLADLLAIQGDYKEAFIWYEKAGGQGIPQAHRKKGDCYLYGLGVEKDIAAAIICYQAAARQKEPVALLRLKELCPDRGN